MKKIRVSKQMLEFADNYKRWVNSIPLENMDYSEFNCTTDPERVKEWCFCGLSNTDFLLGGINGFQRELTDSEDK